MADQKPRLTLVKLNKKEFAAGRHVLIVESPGSKRAVSLNGNVFSIGRHPNNDLVINDPLASRHHATIAWMRYTDGKDKNDYSYWIIDGKGKRKKSRNGISINGYKKSLHRLISGDKILIGDEIKISYNYITYSSDNSQLLDYCDQKKPEFKPLYTNKKSHKDTLIIDNEVISNDIPENSGIIDNKLAKGYVPEDNDAVEETILKEVRHKNK